ncbi:MAG: hypothetical protein JWN13_181 [Betaproteobacteria bacterium]|nr:hypothetical protein [Betaproteobacteria bacterium]
MQLERRIAGPAQVLTIDAVIACEDRLRTRADTRARLLAFDQAA